MGNQLAPEVWWDSLDEEDRAAYCAHRDGVLPTALASKALNAGVVETAVVPLGQPPRFRLAREYRDFLAGRC
jgi:hypothetical protein